MIHVQYNSLTPLEKRQKREEYIEHQNGNCWYCQHTLSEKPPAKIMRKVLNFRLFPTGFFRYPVHLQHDHKTGLTEGAVHAYCNAVLWQYHGR